MLKEELAYLAGLIDGEGCFDVKHMRVLNKKKQKLYNSLVPRLRISMTCLKTLQYVNTIFPANLINKTVKNTPNRKPQYEWCLEGEKLLTVLLLLKPYLVTKQEEAEVLLLFPLHPPCGRNGLPSHIVDKRIEIKNQLQKYKSKGRRKK